MSLTLDYIILLSKAFLTSINDGDLRLYTDPQNREFLTSVMSGRIPRELITEAKGGEVHVNMEDHKEEEFKKPKVKKVRMNLHPVIEGGLRLIVFKAPQRTM